jgi:hypothetical protein
MQEERTKQVYNKKKSCHILFTVRNHASRYSRGSLTQADCRCILETGAGQDKKVLLQSHADRQADRRFMTTSSEILMYLLSTETLKTEI